VWDSNPRSQRPKTVHALERLAIVAGCLYDYETVRQRPRFNMDCSAHILLLLLLLLNSDIERLDIALTSQTRSEGAWFEY
jgi:hypothetical protein